MCDVPTTGESETKPSSISPIHLHSYKNMVQHDHDKPTTTQSTAAGSRLLEIEAILLRIALHPAHEPVPLPWGPRDVWGQASAENGERDGKRRPLIHPDHPICSGLSQQFTKNTFFVLPMRTEEERTVFRTQGGPDQPTQRLGGPHFWGGPILFLENRTTHLARPPRGARTYDAFLVFSPFMPLLVNFGHF